MYDDTPPKEDKDTAKSVAAAEEVFGLTAPIVDGADENEYMVPSETTKDKVYTVKTNGTDVLECECIGWKSHKKCKHANRVIIEKIL